MRMSIEEIQQGLKEYHNGFTGCAGNFQEVVDGALEIVCRYQKIEEIVGNYGFDTWLCSKKIREVIEDGNDN